MFGPNRTRATAFTFFTMKSTNPPNKIHNTVQTYGSTFTEEELNRLQFPHLWIGTPKSGYTSFCGPEPVRTTLTPPRHFSKMKCYRWIKRLIHPDREIGPSFPIHSPEEYHFILRCLIKVCGRLKDSESYLIESHGFECNVGKVDSKEFDHFLFPHGKESLRTLDIAI